MELSELSWALGVFEGAGSIIPVNDGRQRRLQVRMTDEDVMRRYAHAVGERLLGPYSQAGRRDCWAVNLNGLRADAVLTAWFPYLSQRRRSRALELGYEPRGDA